MIKNLSLRLDNSIRIHDQIQNGSQGKEPFWTDCSITTLFAPSIIPMFYSLIVSLSLSLTFWPSLLVVSSRFTIDLLDSLRSGDRDGCSTDWCYDSSYESCWWWCDTNLNDDCFISSSGVFSLPIFSLCCVVVVSRIASSSMLKKTGCGERKSNDSFTESIQ